MLRQDDRAVSSAEEHFLDMEGVRGSIPLPPTIAADPETSRANEKPRFHICARRLQVGGADTKAHMPVASVTHFFVKLVFAAPASFLSAA